MAKATTRRSAAVRSQASMTSSQVQLRQTNGWKSICADISNAITTAQPNTV